jgi:hypothetical protein
MTGIASRLIGRMIARRRLRRSLLGRCRKAGLPIDRLHIRDSGVGHAHDLRLSRSGKSLEIAINWRAVLDSRNLTNVFRHRSMAIIDPFVRSNGSIALGNVSDGEESGPDTIVFSSKRRDAILVPDAIFYESRGYADYRRAADAWGAGWAARDEKIVWRGTTTGHGRITSAGMAPDDGSLLPRTRMCLLLRSMKGVDARIVDVAQSADPAKDRSRLEQADILGGRIDPKTWLVRKFAIDIDGNSNAWSNLFTRLLAGCCVLKVSSAQGFRQWYYDELQPWQHFVPVEADLSDLREKIDWCRAHDKRCAEIAAAGRDFACRRDFATEMDGAVDTLNRCLGPR